MVCTSMCKWSCIIAYVIAAVAALFHVKRLYKEANGMLGQTKLRHQALALVVLIASLFTLWCAIRWAVMKKSPESVLK